MFNFNRTKRGYSDGVGLLVILLVIALIVVAPFLLIWAINSLFSQSNDYTFMKWLAAFVLMLFLGGSKASSSS